MLQGSFNIIIFRIETVTFRNKEAFCSILQYCQLQNISFQFKRYIYSFTKNILKIVLTDKGQYRKDVAKRI